MVDTRMDEMVGSFAQGLMSAEVDGSVELGGVSGARIGYRTRRWDTRVGSIELRIPEAGEGCQRRVNTEHF